MAYTGKIGFHFPGRVNPNIDASDVKFLPAGISNPTSNDLVQVNKVYAIPTGVTITSVSDLQNYVVWEKTQYIKYWIELSDDTNNLNFPFRALYKDGSIVGNVFSNAIYKQYPYTDWRSCESAKIQALQSGVSENDADIDLSYGNTLRLTYTTINLTSFGFKSPKWTQGHTHYTITISGVDSNESATILKTTELNNIQSNTIYTITL